MTAAPANGALKNAIEASAAARKRKEVVSLMQEY
jgi:hypothetical protein